MGVEPYFLAATLKCVVAQRLVRRICPYCQAKGCKICFGTGYNGRIALHEILRADNQLRNLILNGKSLDEIKNSVNLKTLADDANEKIRAGVTNLKEIYRVLGDDANVPR